MRDVRRRRARAARAPGWSNSTSTLQRLLLPKDPDDAQPMFLEIRAGTGGDESALFAGDLLRMYLRYAERQRWQVEIVSSSPAELGGYKEVIVRVASGRGGDRALAPYARLKFESGGHRVQRVPVTETQGRIHTSACTLAVMPEPDDIADVDIRPDEIRIDTFRASGAGGQHINKTDSAVRITHLPTGIVVECQDDRSQHKNKAQALKVLAARIKDKQVREQQASEAATRTHAGRLRRPLGAHPHLQLPAGSRDRPPHQPDAVQARVHPRRRSRRIDRRAGRRAPGRTARRSSPISDRAAERPDDGRRSARDRALPATKRCCCSRTRAAVRANDDRGLARGRPAARGRCGVRRTARSSRAGEPIAYLPATASSTAAASRSTTRADPPSRDRIAGRPGIHLDARRADRRAADAPALRVLDLGTGWGSSP